MGDQGSSERIRELVVKGREEGVIEKVGEEGSGGRLSERVLVYWLFFFLINHSKSILMRTY